MKITAQELQELGSAIALVAKYLTGHQLDQFDQAVADLAATLKPTLYTKDDGSPVTYDDIHALANDARAAWAGVPDAPVDPAPTPAAPAVEAAADPAPPVPGSAGGGDDDDQG